jgi:hypothetical protein
MNYILALILYCFLFDDDQEYNNEETLVFLESDVFFAF